MTPPPAHPHPINPARPRPLPPSRPIPPLTPPPIPPRPSRAAATPAPRPRPTFPTPDPIKPPPPPPPPPRPSGLARHLVDVAILATILVGLVAALTGVLWEMGDWIATTSADVTAELVIAALSLWLITSILTTPPRRSRPAVSRVRAPRPGMRVVARPAAPGVAAERGLGTQLPGRRVIPVPAAPGLTSWRNA